MQNTQRTPTIAELILQKNNTKKTFQTFLCNTDSPAKKELEQFINTVFAKHYNAQVCHFYPNLLGAYDEQQRPYAAVGYRVADEKRLFLEQHLKQPIEQSLSAFSEEQAVISPLCREHIIEIGNLAATQQGACRDLFQLLTLHFHRSQFRWIVFTGTRAVRVTLKKMHLKTYTLANAHIDALTPCSRQSWGSYYDQKPIVMAIPIKQTLSKTTHNHSINKQAKYSKWRNL